MRHTCQPATRQSWLPHICCLQAPPQPDWHSGCICAPVCHWAGAPAAGLLLVGWAWACVQHELQHTCSTSCSPLMPWCHAHLLPPRALSHHSAASSVASWSTCRSMCILPWSWGMVVTSSTCAARCRVRERHGWGGTIVHKALWTGAARGRQPLPLAGASVQGCTQGADSAAQAGLDDVCTLMHVAMAQICRHNVQACHATPRPPTFLPCSRRGEGPDVAAAHHHQVPAFPARVAPRHEVAGATSCVGWMGWDCILLGGWACSMQHAACSMQAIGHGLRGCCMRLQLVLSGSSAWPQHGIRCAMHVAELACYPLSLHPTECVPGARARRAHCEGGLAWSPRKSSTAAPWLLTSALACAPQAMALQRHGWLRLFCPWLNSSCCFAAVTSLTRLVCALLCLLHADW